MAFFLKIGNFPDCLLKYNKVLNIVSGDCSTRMDLVFILDASTDVSAADFTSMQAFVVNLIDR